ncbi:hypothetical protein Ccar_16755 [Clostridium carboxidivorans P7]|uniref:hypothetical protein n=1 Tax=Clostridium carboxidivorans TaxID=217159 RepID=UPI00064E9609|nr:hypothetical protein [Clostridium carboxidivorans]AKN32418.1 hypothetical protein Ccar_16755 [Clostridium carboxidivorans P7]
MDHAINSLEPFIKVTFSYEFLLEWQSGKYKKYSECPSYEELKALIDASNIMRKYLGWEPLSIKSMLEEVKNDKR